MTSTVPRAPFISGSQPSIVAELLDALDVRPGQSVLEIGTGWTAALLAHRVGAHGRVVTVEVDPILAEGARYDRVICTASIREVVPRAWLDQLRTGGRLVTPWATNWSNGVMLTLNLTENGLATGRFSGDFDFMRGQRRAPYGWTPEGAEMAQAVLSTAECRGSDLYRMLSPDNGRFAIGARLSSCRLVIDWNRHGKLHHNLELDDAETKSWAQLDANLNDPGPFTVRQLGPRQLWDEVEAAYDWWYEQDKPGPDRFGFQSREGRQWVWLDEPDNVVRILN